MQKRKAVSLFITGVCSLSVLHSCRPHSGPPSLGDGDDALLRSQPLRTFELNDKHTRRFSTVYTLRRGEETLRVEVVRNIEKDSARMLLDDGVMSLEALYANALSPYPGDISKKIVPDKKYRPRPFKKNVAGIEYTYFALFAGERLGFGAATRDLVKYRALLGWLYDEKRERFYKVKYFVPLDVEWKKMEAFFLSLKPASSEGA